MPLRIVGKNVEVNRRDRMYIERKVNRLRKLVSKIETMDLSIEEERHLMIARFLVKAGKIEKNVRETGDSLREAFDKALDKVERAVRRAKEKRIDRSQRPRSNPRVAIAEQSMLEPVEDTDQANGHRTIVVERLPYKPMSVEEAAEQIALDDRHLMVFVNDTSERLNVLYQRNDGCLGLIEPRVNA